MFDEITPADHYRAAMDSVNLINATLANPSSVRPEDIGDLIYRNAEHLKIMVTKDYWTDEDLTPFSDAIVSAEEFAQGLNPAV